MSCCYISSNNNRLYAAVEATLAQVAAVTANQRFPSVRMELVEQLLKPARRDKTGGRTFVGLPGGFRHKNSFALRTYMAEWAAGASEPSYGALFQGAMGTAAAAFAGGVVSAVSGQQLTFAAPHGLTPNQAIVVGEDIRFVDGVVNTTAVQLNAPFTVAPAAGAAVTRTVTYKLAATMPGVSVYDYWDPAGVQRILAGAAMDKLRVSLNGDFHTFDFAGEAVNVIDSVSFTAGTGGLATYPAEPALVTAINTLVPGNLGQAWMGLGPTQMMNVLEADVDLDNGVVLRNREFGTAAGACIAAGERTVTLNARLLADCSTAMQQIYQAATQRSPIPVMFQMGQQAGQLCGVYLKSVVPEVPQFDDRDPRLEWVLKAARAQGVDNDEMVIAFG